MPATDTPAPRFTSADACPSCTGIHGQPADWPTCPEHEHWLYLSYRNNAGYHYRCPAWKCKHDHTQKERATMTATHETATAALAIRDGQQFWDGKQLAALRQLGAEDAPEGDLQVFFHYCQATGLDPFAKHIRLRKDRQKNAAGQWENRWSIETEIDGYRVIAHRAAKRDGVELSYGPPIWFDAAEGEHKIWLGEDPPAGAARTVYKNGKPFPAVIRLKSFAKYTKDGQLQALWAVMPDHLIGKCAEAQALRMAFPHDLEGIRLAEEAGSNGHAPPQPPPALSEQAFRQEDANRQRLQQQQRPSTSNRQALAAAIRAQFDRLGLEDQEERAVYVNQLNNKPADAPWRDLTDPELKVALDVLSEKEDGEYVISDLAALVELCNPEPAAS